MSIYQLDLTWMNRTILRKDLGFCLYKTSSRTKAQWSSFDGKSVFHLTIIFSFEAHFSNGKGNKQNKVVLHIWLILFSNHNCNYLVFRMKIKHFGRATTLLYVLFHFKNLNGSRRSCKFAPWKFYWDLPRNYLYL